MKWKRKIKIMYRKTGLFWTNFSFLVKRQKSKDRSESYVHILMLVRPTDLGMTRKSTQKIY